MARIKNALRQHFVAPVGEDLATEPTKWLELAKWITTASPEDNEETEEEGFYDGDGTPETDVSSISLGWTYEGYYDSEDPAQKLLADMKTTPHARKVWQRVVSSDGATETVGLATVTAITAGGGEATAYEDFAATISYNRIPEVREVTPEA